MTLNKKLKTARLGIPEANREIWGKFKEKEIYKATGNDSRKVRQLWITKSNSHSADVNKRFDQNEKTLQFWHVGQEWPELPG